jgi:spermidine/putrescine transport system permease protein
MQKSRLRELLLTIPSFVWLLLFFLIPTLIIFSYAFKPHDIYGGIEEGWTFQTITELWNPFLLQILWRTLWLSTAATAICLLLALPMGYQLLLTPPRWRNLLLLLVVIPFWSSFLIRIFAWKTVLHPEGALHEFLVMIGLIDPYTTLLYNSWAVLLVMVYTLLPFAVLPIFASASKFNFQLIEAAMDLGASRSQAFLRIFVPAIKKGIVTACVMVFIPAIGSYVVPDMVGGGTSEVIGNKIAQKIFVERNLPEASALSALLALGVFLLIGLIAKLTRGEKHKEAEARGRE